MAIYQLKSLLDRYTADYLVLEFNHLFVSTTLREEIWLLQKKNDDDFLRDVLSRARDFDLPEIDADRNVETYSGGQKAMLACLLVLIAVSRHGIRNVRILLVNVLESISDAKRQQLITELQQLRSAVGIRVFTGDLDHLKELCE